MSSRIRLFVSVLVLCAFGASARAAIMHDSTPNSQYEGLASQSKYEAAGYLTRLNNGVYEPAGSGVLIDAQDQSGFWVLTAGHVILKTGTVPFDGFQFGLAADAFSDPGPMFAADAWYSYPGYSDSDTLGATADIGLIHLSSAPNVTPAIRFRGTDQLGTLLTRLGYGTPGTVSTGLGDYDGRERASNNVGFRFGLAGRAISDYWTTRFDAVGWPNYQPLGSTATPGDSGGGSYATIGGQTYLVGITSGGDTYWQYGDATFALRVSLYNNWIDQTIAAYTPEPGTVVLLLLAFPLLTKRKAA